MQKSEPANLAPTSPGLLAETGEPLLVLPRELSQLPPPATLVGHKAHGLARLLAVKARVPRFGVLTGAAFDTHLAQPELRALLEHARAADLDDEANRAAWAERLTHAVSSAPLPPSVAQAALTLFEAFREEDHVAIRASPVGSGAEAAVLAGCPETFLFLRGRDLVVEAIRQTLASAFSLKVLSARHAAGLDVLGTRFGVIVQRMVRAEVSGSCRSLAPAAVPGESPHVEIVATFGVGGGSSRAQGGSRLYHDVIRVARPALAEEGLSSDAAIEEQRSAKGEALHLDEDRGQGTRLVTVAEDDQDAPALAAREARLVAEEALRVEAALGSAQALEFAFAGRLLYLLQASPLLTPSARIESTRVRSWDVALLPEGIRGLTTPLSFGLFQATFIPAFARAMEQLGGSLSALDEKRPVRGRLLGLLGGRVYVSTEAVRAFLDLLPDGALIADGLSRGLGVSGLTSSSALPPPDDDVVRINRIVKVARKQTQSAEEAIGALRESLLRLGAEPLHDRDPDGLVDVLDLALGLAREVETHRVAVQIAAAASYGVLTRMIASWAPDVRPGVVLDLFADETDLARDAFYEGVSALAREVERDRILTELFNQERNGSTLWDRLDGLPAADQFIAHLRDVTARGSGRLLSDRKVEFPSAGERADIVLDLVRAMRADRRDVEALAARTEGLRKKAEYVVFKDLSDKRVLLGLASRRKLVERALEETRRGLALHETLRVVQGKLTGLCRRVVLTCGQRLFEHGLLHHPLDVFYLSLDELRGLVRGTAFDSDPKPMVGSRKRLARKFPHELPPAFDTVGVLATCDLDSLVSPPPATSPGVPRGTIRGEPGASGEVSGTVQVAHLHLGAGTARLSVFRDIEPGGVVLTAEDDPGLFARLALADAVAFGNAAPLSSTVVKLRAFGIPVVLGPLHVQRQFEPGERVLLDGRAGTLKHVESLGEDHTQTSPRYDPDAFTRLAAPTDPQKSALAPPPPLTDEELDD